MSAISILLSEASLKEAYAFQKVKQVCHDGVFGRCRNDPNPKFLWKMFQKHANIAAVLVLIIL
jgi:hypothetical protein